MAASVWDVFNTDAFGLRTLTDSMIKAPYQPGRLGKLGLFVEKGVPTTLITIEEKNGRLSIIPTSKRGAPSSTLGVARRKVRPFEITHLQREAEVTADQVQNVRAFGSADATQGVQDLINGLITDLKAMHEVTLERFRLGALKGQILDADDTVLLDLFDAFEVAQLTGTLDMDGTDTRSLIVGILRRIEANLGADVTGLSGYRALCGDTFFDTFIELDDVKESLKFQESIQLRSDLRNGFDFGGVIWENYKGRLQAADEDSDETLGQPFLADDEAYILPIGAPIYRTYFGPADFMEAVNTIGLPYYAKVAIDPEFQRYAKVHTQSNPLPLVLRPNAIAKVTFTT